MSLTIKTNIASLIAQGSLTNSTNKLNQAIERMSTGSKINHASDNAANYLISTQLTTKLNSYYTAEDNISQALDMVNTAEGALSTIHGKVKRLRELSLQMQNMTSGDSGKSVLNKEAISIINEIYRIKNTSEYNGISLFGGLENVSEITFDDGTTKKTRGFMVKVAHRDTSQMTTVESLDPNVTITGGTYSISKADELVKAAQMTKSGTLKSAEFVLANNIDLEAWCKENEDIGGWQGFGAIKSFDGNGYVIANAKIGTNSSAHSFFNDNTTVLNVGLEDIEINTQKDCASAFGSYGMKLTNCYATGTIDGRNHVGGLVGLQKGGVLLNCYADVKISGYAHSAGCLIGSIDGNENNRVENCFTIGSANVGYKVCGLIGSAWNRADRTLTITNCASIADVSAQTSGGGLIGKFSNDGTLNFSNCYSTGAVSAGENNGGLIGTNSYTGEISNCYYNKESSGHDDTGKGIGLTSAELNKKVAEKLLPDYDLALPMPSDIINSSGNLYSPKTVDFWVGINSSDSDKINLSLVFTINGLKELCYLGLEHDKSLEKIDDMLASISDKASEYGALQNRFESALESVAINIENLTSTQSTIRDADIADVSSEYIKMQILQTASATLLATANQTPALALQLL